MPETTPTTAGTAGIVAVAPTPPGAAVPAGGPGPVRLGNGWACPACDLTTGHLGSTAEALQLGDVHDRLQHGGAPTAILLAGTDGTSNGRQAVCESCRQARARLVWDYPPASAAFAACTACARTMPARCGPSAGTGGGR